MATAGKKEAAKAARRIRDEDRRDKDRRDEDRRKDMGRLLRQKMCEGVKGKQKVVDPAGSTFGGAGLAWRMPARSIQGPRRIKG